MTGRHSAIGRDSVVDPAFAVGRLSGPLGEPIARRRAAGSSHVHSRRRLVATRTREVTSMSHFGELLHACRTTDDAVMVIPVVGITLIPEEL